MKMHAQQCKSRGIDFLVIGDQRSPNDFRLDGCRFVSVEEQQSLSFRLAGLLPVNHYSRKNLGYLLSRNKDLIVETDDDNLPKENFWPERNATVQARLAGD